MSSTLLDQLAQFDRMKGKEPIDSTVIREENQEAPLVPTPYQVPHDLDPRLVNDPDEFDDFAEPPPSPLIPRVAPRMPQAAVSPPPAMPMPTLLILDKTAGYKGRDVELSEAEHRDVVRIVLGAVARTVKEQLAEVGVKRARRRADKTDKNEHPMHETIGVPKRGRPKKEKA